MEFEEKDSIVFDEVMAVLKRHSSFEMFSMEEETVISLPGLTISLEQRKAVRSFHERTIHNPLCSCGGVLF